ncbi:MAG TPA: hypothetical protein VMW90_02095, partial [Acidobacteriota bacterium]|nr:hypothetical protein [Acidobacteriota bacterium]
LPFFPEASLKYAEGVIEKGKSEEVALVDAKKRWKGSDFSRGEVEDEYYKICFGETDPLDAEFQELAIEILAPLIRSRKRLLK